MASLKEIRIRINAVKNIQKITKAMKMMAAVRMRKAQDRILSTRPYAYKLNQLMSQMIALTDVSGNELTKSRDIKKRTVVLITSDRGLCGAFNSNIIKFTAAYIAEIGRDTAIVTIGKKGYDFFFKRKYNVVKNFPNVFANLNIQQSNEIVSYLKDRYLSGEADSIEIIYNEFKSVVKQNITKDLFLPFDVSAAADKSVTNLDFIYERSSKDILEELIPKDLNIQFWKALLESNASEQGARMTAMDSASNNASDLIKFLNLNYNRARQESITNELLEIVSGAEALSKG
ncbi:MAG TPA: ATP synthase F1 subunit gamma [Ignavibacteria bacterium]|nr:ATP synthase F1 subunit gamma [Ignavibacteria bacterium]